MIYDCGCTISETIDDDPTNLQSILCLMHQIKAAPVAFAPPDQQAELQAKYDQMIADAQAEAEEERQAEIDAMRAEAAQDAEEEATVKG